jgi:hypothetical protein
MSVVSLPFLFNHDAQHLTDYRHQEDEDIASRGAIAMKTAILKISPGGDKTRFEIHSTPSRGHATGQKWYMRANHHVEAAGWTQALGKSIQWARRDEQILRKSEESELTALKPKSVRSSFQSVMSVQRRDMGTRSGGSQSSFIGIADESMEDGPPPETNKAAKSRFTSDNEEHNDNSSASVRTQSPPHNTTFDLQGNSAAAQMELTTQLLSNLALPPDAAPRTQELRTALKESFAIVQTMIDEYVQMAKDREEWWKSQLQRERERQTVWEESLQTVVREGEALEQELRIRSRKRGSRFFDVGVNDIGGGTLRQRPMIMGLVSPVLEEHYFSPSVRPAPITIVSPPEEVNGLSTPTVPSSPASAGVTPTAQRMALHDQEDEDAVDTDEEDEFFDAIEANALPNLVVSQLLSSPMHAVPALSFMNGEHFAGYQNLRTRLPIGSDNRPSTSLWSVLKHSIGKDLTRISFPVMFNEPTSMLQRMVSFLWLMDVHTVLFRVKAEDMEFSECRKYLVSVIVDRSNSSVHS